MSNDVLDEYTSMKKAAQMLGVSRQRVHQMLKEQGVEKKYLNERSVLIPRTWIETELRGVDQRTKEPALEIIQEGHHDVWQVLLDFFKAAHIQKTLSLIQKNHLSGWEKWWQIELAAYLSEADPIDKLQVGLQSSLDQPITSFDIGFCLKRHSKIVWHFVELIQDNDYKICINKIFRDIERVFTANPHTLPLVGQGCIVFAGVFQTEDYNNVTNYVGRRLKAMGRQVEEMPIYLEPINDYYLLLLL